MTEEDRTMVDVDHTHPHTDAPEIRTDGGDAAEDDARDEPTPEMRDVDHAGADTGVSGAFERGPETGDETE